MQAERKIVKQILYLLRGLDQKKPELVDIELVYNKDGIVIGYNLKIVSDKEKILRLVTDED